MGVSIPAAARALGISPQALRKAIEKGTVPVEMDGSIDVEKARDAWIANSHPGQGADKDAAAEANGKDAANYRMVRVAREALEVRIKEVEFKRMTGELLPAEEVRRDAFNAARSARDRLQLLIDRLPPLLLGVNSIEELRVIIKREVQSVCDELGDAA